MNDADFKFYQGVEVILEVELLGNPNKGRIVEVYDNRSRLMPSSIALKAAEQFNEATVSVEYKVARWAIPGMDGVVPDEYVPKLGQIVDFDGRGTAVPLGELDNYREAREASRREMNKRKVSINAFEKKYKIDKGWGH